MQHSLVIYRLWVIDIDDNYSDFQVNEPHFISHAISLRDPEG
jgi:hypothetical protein